MRTPWKRIAIVTLLGALIVGGVSGLAIVLDSSRAQTTSQLQRSAQSRASLAAALIDTVFRATPLAPEASAAVSRRRVTAADLSASGATPFVAVVGAGQAGPRLLAARPALTPFTARLITSSGAVGAAVADGRHHLSDLLVWHGRRGVLDAAPYGTPFGRRVVVGWLPLTALTAPLDGYLGDVAHYNIHASQTRVLVLDGTDAVIGSATGAPSGAPLRDRALRTALTRDGDAGTFTAGVERFYAVARLAVAPWRVVYTLPTSALYASRGDTWTLSFLILAAFGAAAVVCVLLLIRLLASAANLARANASLAQRNQVIERATEAKSRFVASLSHELRNPLSAVTGFSELMHEGRAGPLGKTQREYLGIIRASADHLLRLINEVLDLAKIEAGHLRLQTEAIEPTAVAAHCVDSMRRLATDKRITIAFDPVALGPAQLDPGRLRQVILNFLSNAIKFTGTGGHVALSLTRDGERLLIEVTDTGTGIAAEDQPRVFEEFVQLGNGPLGGSGLGLAVTRQIVEAQGGEVGVRSRPGAGSTFHARVPWIAPDDGDGPSSGQGPAGRGVRRGEPARGPRARAGASR